MGAGCFTIVYFEGSHTLVCENLFLVGYFAHALVFLMLLNKSRNTPKHPSSKSEQLAQPQHAARCFATLFASVMQFNITQKDRVLRATDCKSGGVT